MNCPLHTERTQACCAGTPAPLRARRGRGAWAQAPVWLCGRYAYRKQPRVGDADAAGRPIAVLLFCAGMADGTTNNGSIATRF